VSPSPAVKLYSGVEPVDSEDVKFKVPIIAFIAFPSAILLVDNNISIGYSRTFVILILKVLTTLIVPLLTSTCILYIFFNS
jgi:hypothetical protein